MIFPFAFRKSLLFVPFLIVIQSTSHAQQSDILREWRFCDAEISPVPEPRQRVPVCSRLISVGKAAGGSQPYGGATYGEYIWYGAHYARAVANSALQRYDLAIPDFDVFFEGSQFIRPLGMIDRLVYGRRALAYYSTGQFAKALEDSGRDDSPWGFLLRGDIEVALGRYRDALSHYEEFARHYPETPSLVDKIANVRQLVANPQSPAPAPTPVPPASPDNPNPACKMYPNLC